ncbi:MAG: hypothetical protein V1655_01020 [bacterium]
MVNIKKKKKFPKGVEIVSGAIIRKGDKILMGRQPKWSNKWTFPGGHIEGTHPLGSIAKPNLTNFSRFPTA